ncbi:DUF262 domain-containing protein [Natronospirillum operosum]|uniref:DUF262 domain-containing protein n=1 Tax=Natronospirillum operosum TaxID=2759953 RepID=A0A4Z0WDK2_9GAMM|nr:DUF262 domain-containing protein [Natronospirillum operosum]TGG92819.1 DUF262 domain-containing protein [Natronospirillum operosum]
MKNQNSLAFPVSKDTRDAAENQIREQQKETRYDIRDFTIEYIIQKFQDGLFFVPKYQREFIWPQNHKERFIESIILGLPVPMMFLADLDDGRLEIVDGAQRIQTLEEFRNSDLKLKDLKILDSLKGFTYEDLPESQQRKFDTKALRIVVLEDATSANRRKEIFNRINTGSVKAKPSEVRRGDFESPFMQFVIRCASDAMFRKTCPVSKSLVSRREPEELVLRFFAYSDRYKVFKHDVYKFLDKYTEDLRDNFDKDKMESEFNQTMHFVNRHFPNGFAKTKNSSSTPRVRFEAIAVGTNLALRQNPNLTPGSLSWLDSEEFQFHTTTHASNSAPKLKKRVEFVRDMLLGK